MLVLSHCCCYVKGRVHPIPRDILPIWIDKVDSFFPFMTFPAGNSLLTIVAKDGPKMNSINVATAWHRLAKLSKRKEIPSGGRQLLEDVRMEILERLTEKFADDFDAMNLSNVVWSCGALNYHPTGSVLPRLCDNLIAKAEMGLSRPRYPASETKAFPSAQALSNCLWALATLRSMHALKFAKLVAKVTPKLTDQFNPALAGVGGAFVTQTIANQLWSYATLREHPGDELMDKFAAMVTEHVHHFKSQELSNIIWSYSALSHYPGDDFMRVVRLPPTSVTSINPPTRQPQTSIISPLPEPMTPSLPVFL